MDGPVPRIVPGAALALLLLGAPLPAAAQLVLTWEAPPECPTGEVVRAEVARLLGGALPAELALTARGVATRADDRWTLRLHTATPEAEGERVVEGDACAPLADAAALILALMIDPVAVAEHAPAEPAEPLPPAEPAPPAAPPHAAIEGLADPAPAEEPAPRRSDEGAISRVVEHDRDPRTEGRPRRDPPPETPGEPLRGALGVGGALDVGSVPDVSGAISVEGAFGIPVLEARVRATFVFGREAARDRVAGARITTGMLDARACVHPFDEARFLYGCLGLALGVSVAEGFGLSRTEVGVGTFGAAVAGLGVAWAPEPWFDLDLDASLIVPFNPLEFAVRGSPDDVFHEQAPAAGRFGLSAHVRF